MDLTTAVGNYLTAWEGITELQRAALADVLYFTERATSDEINTEYNKLSRQSLWNSILVDVFHDELLKRLQDEATFAISTAWRSIQEWLASPIVHIRLTFEEMYSLIDMDGAYIPPCETQIQNVTLTNDNFSEVYQRNIFRILLHDNQTDAQVWVDRDNNKLHIVGISNTGGQIKFISNSNVPENAEIVSVSAQIIESNDFNVIKRMITGLRDGTYDIVEIYADRLGKTEADFEYQSTQLLDADTT